MNQKPIDQLMILLARSCDLELSADDATACLNLKIQDCTQDDLKLLESVIQQAKSSLPVEGIDYTRYFDAIMKSPLYKPGNPILAVTQVAKAYDLDVDNLKQSFSLSRK